MGQREKFIYLIHIIAPLVLGAVLYLWIKPNAWCSNTFYGFFHLEKPRAFEESDIPLFGSFIKHQLCDSLFAYSLTVALLFILRREKHGIYLACMIAALFETFFEVAQIWGFPGNFDYFDIFAEVAVSVFIFICMKIKQKNRVKKT